MAENQQDGGENWQTYLQGSDLFAKENKEDTEKAKVY